MDRTERRTRRTRAACRYAGAMLALCENSMAEYAAGIDYETETFLRLNSAVIAAERGVSRWRRWWIDRYIVRELDYFAHMGGTG